MAVMSTWSLEIDDRTAVLTFTRPPANWMDFVSMTELAEHLEALAARTDEVTVVMLAGGVDGYFIAHADLDDLARIAAGELPPGDPRAWTRALALLESMPQPTVAAIDGQAWGGGCETALACTMRVASPRAHLGQPEVAVGIIPGAGGTQRLPRLVGSAIGAELCLSGRIVGSDEAKRIGLVNEVLTDEPFVDAARDWCGRIARHSPGAVFAAKRAVVEGLALPLAEGLALEGRAFLEINASADARARNAAVGRPGDSASDADPGIGTTVERPGPGQG
jgi:enoyl-CoA hydratase